jgi:alpha-tubulin suppressor-like RCC1 family protein
MQVQIGKTLGCALDEKGFIWVWGNNTEGELGLGDQINRDLPAPVLQLKGRSITNVACGGKSIICLG